MNTTLRPIAGRNDFDGASVHTVLDDVNLSSKTLQEAANAGSVIVPRVDAKVA